ncbi:hypothetical protein RHO12_09955 [Orbus sturtevantii]|uniref:hypothetical protein n=1 Tax=Orbus sturtevantii TaxID=3074109 RepID=UPI00370D8FBD
MKRIYMIIMLITLALCVSLVVNYILLDRDIEQKGEKAMDYTIYPSSMPENALWRIEQAKQMNERAYTTVFDAIDDENTMIELVKHAWQWDKNAMMHYSSIKSRKDIRGDKPDDMLYFDEFMQKYQSKFLDDNGNRLIEPSIFNQPNAWSYMRDSFAELKYPYASYRMAWVWGGVSGYDSDGIARPLEDKNIENSIKYLNYAMEGGYRKHEMLATWTLFAIQSNFKNEKRTEIIPLSEYRPLLPSECLIVAIDHYQIAAQHSSLFGILRVAEAYLYGIGREQSWVKAYAWSQLLDYAYQKLVQRNSPLDWKKYEGDIIIQYNLPLSKRLARTLTDAQQLESKKIFGELKNTIISWDHEIWSEGIDDFYPKP